MSEIDTYESKLAEWKAKHGYQDPSSEEDETEQALRAADKLLPGDSYCMVCGEGPQPICGMCLITRRDDPYIQDPDDMSEDEVSVENRVRACPKCWAIEYGNQDELSDDEN